MNLHLSLKESVTPVHALLDEDGLPFDDAIEQLRRADLIFGLDIMSKRYYLLHGRERLLQLQETGGEAEFVTVVIGFDEGTDEQERLMLALEMVKGR